MAPPTPGLEADTDPTYARRAAAVARVARVGLALVVGLAVLGVFGGAGPLVRAGAAGERGFAVAYDRFARLDAPVTVEVRLPPGDSAFVLAGALAAGLQVEAVSPAPRSETATADGVRYTVDVEPDEPVTFHARPLRFGVLHGGVALDRGDRLDVAVVVYP